MTWLMLESYTGLFIAFLALGVYVEIVRGEGMQHQHVGLNNPIYLGLVVSASNHAPSLICYTISGGIRCRDRRRKWCMCFSAPYLHMYSALVWWLFAGIYKVSSRLLSSQYFFGICSDFPVLATSYYTSQDTNIIDRVKDYRVSPQSGLFVLPRWDMRVISCSLRALLSLLSPPVTSSGGRHVPFPVELFAA